jgi:hypothetical protein
VRSVAEKVKEFANPGEISARNPVVLKWSRLLFQILLHPNL